VWNTVRVEIRIMSVVFLVDSVAVVAAVAVGAESAVVLVFEAEMAEYPPRY